MAPQTCHPAGEPAPELGTTERGTQQTRDIAWCARLATNRDRDLTGISGGIGQLKVTNAAEMDEKPRNVVLRSRP